MQERSSALVPSRAQRIGAISAVVLLHLAVFLHQGTAPASQPSRSGRAAAQPPSVPVFLAPLAARARSPARRANSAHAKGPVDAQPPVAEGLPAEQAVAGFASGSTGGAQAEPSATATEHGAALATGAPTPRDTDADYSRNPSPAYPPASRRAQEQGRVLLLVLVCADGTAKEVSVEKSSGYPRLDEAALNAVRQWIFVPATRGGIAIAAPIRVPVNFVLSL